MSATAIVLIMLLVFLVVLMLGHPLSFTLGGLAVIFGYLFWGDANVLNIFVRTIAKTITSVSYVCVPLFIFMGAILEKSGVSERLFEALYIVMGRLKGGLALSTVVICALMGAASGIIGASITIMAMLALPTMLKYKYDEKLATGTIMAAGSLGTMIPPSVILVIYGSLANLSIAKLFAGGMGAGLLLASLYGVYVVILCFVRPNAGPAISKEESDRYTVREKFLLTIISIIPALGLIILVLGSILFGIATPNESAAMGAIGAVLIAVAYKKFNWKMIKDACYSTMKTTSMIMWIIVAASMFTSIFLGLGGGEVITNMVLAIGLNKWAVLAFILFLIFIMGMFIDSYGILLIGVPLFTPIIYSLGFDPFWFGIIFAIMIQMSVISPPFAYAAFYLKGVCPEIPISKLYWASIPFICLQVICIVLCCLFPQIILYFTSII